MKLSDSKEIFELMKELGLSKDLSSLSQQELEELSKDPELRNRFFSLLSSANRNLYQELEMSSPFVNTHQDVTYVPRPVSLHSHTYVEILFCRSGTDVEYLVGPDRYKLQKGDIILIPPGVSHRPILPETLAEPYVRDVLWVNTDFLASLEEAFPRASGTERRPATLIRTAGTRWEFLGELFRAGVQEEEQKKSANYSGCLQHERPLIDLHPL